MSLLHRHRVATAALVGVTACVSTAGFDGASTGAPDASAADAATFDDAAPSHEDASVDVVDAAATDGGTLNDLHEEFATSLDPSRWVVFVAAPFSSSQASEQLHLTCTTKTTKDAYIKTRGAYDGREGSVHVNLVNAGGAGVGTDGEASVVWMKLAEAAPGANAIEIGVMNGNVYAKHFVGGASVTLKATKYSPVTMAWIRLRATGGGVAYEYASEVAGPWSQLFTEPTPMALEAVTVELGAGNGTPGEVVFDHVNGP